jgi:hypothetical protein
VNWKYGDNYCAWQLLETPSPEPGKPRELSLYASEGYRTETPRLRRYSLRIDGFVSVSAGFDGGELVTKPLIFDGEELVLNYATSAGGSVQVEVQDQDGQPIDGFGIERSDTLFGDELCRQVTWGGNGDVTPLAGEPVRLRIGMADADLYSFRFQ